MTVLEFIKELKDTVGMAGGSEAHKILCGLYNSMPALPRGYKLSISDPWCAGFASAMWWHFNNEFWFPYECSCSQMIMLAKQEGRFYKEPLIEVGWLIFYDWQRDGSPDHVGFITEKLETAFAVIEGNYGNKVQERIVPYDSKNLYGTIKLDYSNSEVENAKSFVTKNKIMLGDGTDTYWQKPPTREQLATILYRFYRAT